MKFNCGPSRREKFSAKEKWHRWFAWHPVRVAERDCRWLETVERKGEFFCYEGDSFWRFEYRLPSGDA